MSDDQIRQHQRLARGEGVDVPSIETPFRGGPDHGAPARGQLLDSQRACSKGGKVNHGDYDGD